MADPDDPGEDLIEKLGRAERQLKREERRSFTLVAIIAIMLLGIGMMVAFANPVIAAPLSQEGAQAGGNVMLTRPDGTAIWVNPDSVAFVRGPLPGEAGHTTIVFSSGAKQTVLESVKEIIRIMEKEREKPKP